jgi:hypothetical protein
MTPWDDLPAHIKITYQSQAQYEAIQDRADMENKMSKIKDDFEAWFAKDFGVNKKALERTFYTEENGEEGYHGLYIEEFSKYADIVVTKALQGYQAGALKNSEKEVKESKCVKYHDRLVKALEEVVCFGGDGQYRVMVELIGIYSILDDLKKEQEREALERGL